MNKKAITKNLPEFSGLISIIESMVTLFGPNCTASLHKREGDSFPCIAVANKELSDFKTGDDVPKFVKDFIKDEEDTDSTVVGIYYTRNAADHALKNVTTLLRDNDGVITGCVCMSIDISVPLHSFIRSFIPVVDDDLASSITDTDTSEASPHVNDLISRTMEQAAQSVGDFNGISAVDRNVRLVKFLKDKGIFSIRGSVGIVADRMGVSRYTIYNYLKSADAENKS